MYMNQKDKIKHIQEANRKLLNEGEYGGKGNFELPSNHKAGITVPKGGSSCANCQFWNGEKKECGNEYFIKWNGSGKIPGSPDEYCSDWWQHEK